MASRKGVEFMVGVCYIAFMIYLLGLSGAIDYEDEINERKHYCHMTNLWIENIDLPLDQRPGWPPFDGYCHGHD